MNSITPQHLHIRAQATIKLLQSQIQDGDIGAFEQFGHLLGRLYTYSQDNVLLAYAQKPDATLLATVSGWQQERRQVLPGRRPVLLTAPAKDRSFQVMEFFDLQDTTGEHLRIHHVLGEFSSTDRVEEALLRCPWPTQLSRIPYYQGFEVRGEVIRLNENLRTLPGEFLMAFLHGWLTCILTPQTPTGYSQALIQAEIQMALFALTSGSQLKGIELSDAFAALHADPEGLRDVIHRVLQALKVLGKALFLPKFRHRQQYATG